MRSHNIKLDIEISPMRISDAVAVTELTRQLGYPSTTEEIKKRFEGLQTQPGNLILVARLPNGVACGWIHLRTEISLGSDPRIEIAGLVIDEKMRGHGIGAKLMDAAENYAREREIPFIRLRSNISRVDAHRFYERLGYEIKKTSHVLEKKL